MAFQGRDLTTYFALCGIIIDFTGALETVNMNLDGRKDEG